MNAQYAIMQYACTISIMHAHAIIHAQHAIMHTQHVHSDMHSKYAVMYAHITIMCIQNGSTCTAIPVCATPLKLGCSFICFKIAPLGATVVAMET